MASTATGEACVRVCTELTASTPNATKESCTKKPPKSTAKETGKRLIMACFDVIM
jgi:hypothetical protein